MALLSPLIEPVKLVRIFIGSGVYFGHKIYYVEVLDGWRILTSEIIFYSFISNVYVLHDLEMLEGQFSEQVVSKTLIVDIQV